MQLSFNNAQDFAHCNYFIELRKGSLDFQQDDINAEILKFIDLRNSHDEDTHGNIMDYLHLSVTGQTRPVHHIAEIHKTVDGRSDLYNAVMTSQPAYQGVISELYALSVLSNQLEDPDMDLECFLEAFTESHNQIVADETTYYVYTVNKELDLHKIIAHQEFNLSFDADELMGQYYNHILNLYQSGQVIDSDTLEVLQRTNAKISAITQLLIEHAIAQDKYDASWFEGFKT